MLANRRGVGKEKMRNLMASVCKCSRDHPGMEVAWLLGNLSLSSVSTSETWKSSAQGAGFLSCPAFTPDSVCTHSRPAACREDAALLLFDQSWNWGSEKLCDLGKSTLRKTRQLCLIYSFTSNVRPNTRILKLTAQTLFRAQLLPTTLCSVTLSFNVSKLEPVIVFRELGRWLSG